MNRKLTFAWFLLGLGSQLQVVFSLSISEVLVLIVAPFLVVSEIQHMRRHGVLPFFYMAVLLFLGCIVSLIANHAQSYQAVRGVSITVVVLCMVVVGHYMLRTDPDGLKWYFWGAMLSGFICIFVFQKSVEVYSARGADVESIIAGPTFWIQRLGSIFTTPILAYYLKIPLAYSFAASLLLAIFSIMTSASGRAASLAFIGAAAIVILGRKKRKSMMSLGRHFILVLCSAIVGIFTIKAVYQWAALNNYLGEKARAKYEHQTAGGSGIIKLLIGGRADAFVGLLAIAEAPVLGKGYWAPDTEDYYEMFLAKYGTPDDYDEYMKWSGLRMSMGMRNIPCHSHITSFWLWFGLPGLLFWLYVIYVILRYLKNDAPAVPQWFYWLAAGSPGIIWHVFFSPFNARVGLPLYVVGMLIARAVRLGKYQLPFKMIREIDEAERR